jgi:hypothetical protein
MRSGLQLQRCASKPPPAAASPKAKAEAEKKPATWAPSAKRELSKDAPEIDNATWAKDLIAAFAKTDITERATAMFALVEKALKGIGLRARMTDPSPKEPDPKNPNAPERLTSADYEPAPVINFDVRLNEKWPPATVADEDQGQLSDNNGYSFLGPKGEAYVVLGPGSLMSPEEEAELKKDPDLKEAKWRFDPTPDSVRMYAEHELLHVDRGHLKRRSAKDKTEKKHKKPGERKSKDDPTELEAWTIDFVNYFHLQGRLFGGGKGRYLGSIWKPLLDYYRAVTDPDAKKKTFNMLVGYYNAAPADPSGTGIRTLFHRWLRTCVRQGQREGLVAELGATLKLDIDPKKAQ